MPDSGRLMLEGRDVTGKSPHWIGKAGILRKEFRGDMHDQVRRWLGLDF